MPVQPPAPPPRPRIAPALARRIDRLARRAHAFHRFAHHPLCGRYAGEWVALGRRTRLCRGCLLAALGSMGGLLIGLAIHPPLFAAWASLATAAALAALAHRLRLPKTAGRLAPAAAAGFAAAGGWLALACAALLGLGWAAIYRWRGPDRSACVDCPERTARVCSGLAPVVRRERAFQRLASRWMARTTAGVSASPVKEKRVALSRSPRS